MSRQQQRHSIASNLVGNRLGASGVTNLSEVSAFLTVLEDEVKKNAHLFQTNQLHKVDEHGNSIQEVQMKQQEEANAKKRKMLLEAYRTQLNHRQQKDSQGATTAMGGSAQADSSTDKVLSPFLAVRDYTNAKAVLPASEAQRVEDMFASKKQHNDNEKDAPSAATTVSSPTKKLRAAPRIEVPEEMIAKHAAEEFELMMLHRIPQGGATSSGATSPQGGSPVKSAKDAPLRHPSLVPMSQYVKSQLEALRFSVNHGFQYHNHFDLHVATAQEERRIMLSALPSRVACATDFVTENRKRLHDASPQALLEEATKEVELQRQRTVAPADEVEEWYRAQIDLKRDMAERVALQRKEHMRRASRVARGESEASISIADQSQTSQNLLNTSFFVNEREAATAVRQTWLALVMLGSRNTLMIAAAEKALSLKRESEEVRNRRRRMNTEHMNSLIALDIMKRKYEKCREILRDYVQSWKRRRHGHAVDLILRVLRHRHRMYRTIAQVRWYKRSVIMCQRQVRIFFQSRAARRMLLHLQWLNKECALLQCPNQALQEIHNQWMDQKRIVDTTRLIASEYQRDNRGLVKGVQQQQKAAAIKRSPAQTVAVDEIPVPKLGGPQYVVWSTKVSWVPHGGVPLEVRIHHVNTAMHTLSREFRSALLSADATRKFFMKQKARYETEGLESLGLPRPRPPRNPIFFLFMAPMTLHVQVRLAIKERGTQNPGQQTGGIKPKPMPIRPSAPTADDALESPSRAEKSSTSSPPASRQAKATSTTAAPATSPSKLKPKLKTVEVSPRPVLKKADVSPRKADSVLKVEKPRGEKDVDNRHRKSILLEHFDSVVANVAEEGKLPTTVRSDEEYAKLLGKPSVQTMRNFIEDRPLFQLHRFNEGPVAHKAQEEVFADPQDKKVNLHLKSLSKHYESEALKRHAESYHVPLPPSTLSPPLSPAKKLATVSVSLNVQAPSAPRPLPNPARTQPLAGGATISQRQLQERLKTALDETVRNPLTDVYHRPAAPLGDDPQRDIPKLLAFGGSSNLQRRLMVSGAPQPAKSQQCRWPTDVSSIDILSGMSEARTKASLLAQARRTL